VAPEPDLDSDRTGAPGPGGALTWLGPPAPVDEPAGPEPSGRPSAGDDTTPAAAPAPGSTPTSERGRRRRSPLLAAAAVLVVLALVSGLVVLAVAAASMSERASRLELELDTAEARLGDAEQRAADLDAALEDLRRDAAASDAGLSDRLTEVETAVQDLPDTAAVAALVNESVFVIDSGLGQGSGFVVRSEGGVSVLVTNHHVVLDAWLRGGTVQLRRGDLELEGTILRVDEGDDLAVVEVPMELPSLEVSRDRPQVGAPVIAVGAPLGLESTVATGIVSAFRTEGDIEYLQFSAPVSPGNSGGPVVDMEGRVIGVTTLKVVSFGAEGLAFAVPVGHVCSTFSAVCP
jgi:putative serine protease PepD